MMRKTALVPLLLLAALLGAGCEGDAGVGDGRIQGTVLAPRAGVSGIAPASGVTVQASRIDDPPLMRSTTTDVYGHFQFDKVPTGRWELSFFGNGFQATPSNRPVTVFVESKRTSQVPDVTLSSVFASGAGVVVVNVVDAVTGEPVSNATVTVGVSSASGGSSGSYTLNVPVSPDSLGQPASQRILVNDEAHLQGSEQPSTVIPIANQVVSVTVRVQPGQAVVQGVLRASAFDDLYRQAGTYSRISITSDSIDPSFLNPVIDGGTGRFSVRVPGSSSASSRRFGLVFSGQGFLVKALSNLVAPRANQTANLSSDVILEPATVTLEGTVVTSSGSLPAGQFDQVTLLELGQSVTLLNGSFFFVRVPVAIPLTVRATATNPFRAGSPNESGFVRVTPAENGSGRFVVGAISTR
ncbi:MAG: carboxypeptidase regulatory-like domain-containing protein [Candidatus Wallbacteria bacterium]|nr:carboxypeptidase regulatory-like domain-containing protein [Candidatus Wallbacteria bacterium]